MSKAGGTPVITRQKSLMSNQHEYTWDEVQTTEGITIASVAEPRRGLHALIGLRDEAGESIGQGVLCLSKAIDKPYHSPDDVYLSCNLTVGSSRRGQFNCMVALEVATRTVSHIPDIRSIIETENFNPMLSYTGRDEL